MNEHVVVDFSRVQAALDLTQRGYEIAASRARLGVAKQRAQITATMIAYGAAACALVIVSVGMAIWLARQRHDIQAQLTPASTPFSTIQTSSVASPPNKIRTEITLFNSIEKGAIQFANPYFGSLTAGHKYSTSNAEHWEIAWCYANFRKGGLEYTVTLANRGSSGLVARPASQSELRELALDHADVSFLRERCPWRER